MSGAVAAEAREQVPGQEAPILELSGIRKEFGETIAVDGIDLGLQPGHLLALLGPSGCGKTTTLRMIAGLEQPTEGEIILQGKQLADGKNAIPPEKRGLGMVFQSYALWPHMNVAANVAFGLKRAGIRGAEVQERVQEVLATVGMEGYGHRPVSNLSGGQQQRIAVARALATRPPLLLLDEPLSNLDTVLRESMRFEIRSLQQEHAITAIYVTHSQDEALALADVVGVMNAGRLEQLGDPEELYLMPRSRFVANFIGLANVLEGTLTDRQGDSIALDLPTGDRIQGVLGAVTPDEVVSGTTMAVAIRPERIRISPAAQSEPKGDAQTIKGTVRNSTFTGNLIDYFVDVPGLGNIRVQAFAPATARPGEDVDLLVRPDACVLLVD